MKRMYTWFYTCTSNEIYVIAVDSVCAINLPGNVISSRIGCSSFSLKQRRVSVTTRLSKILSASSILEILKVCFFLIFFFAFSTYRCIFPYVSGPTAANCCKSDGECNKKTTTSSPLPSCLHWNMFFILPGGKSEQSLCFSPNSFLFPSHCNFFTTWNQDLLTHLKRHQLRNVVGSQKKYLFALSENHLWICPKSYSAFSSRYLKAQQTW